MSQHDIQQAAYRAWKDSMTQQSFAAYLEACKQAGKFWGAAEEETYQPSWGEYMCYDLEGVQ